jgi:hypothetical protein
MKNLLIFGVITFLTACEHDGPRLSSNPIDSEITIEAREVLDVGSRSLTFYCKTKKIYPCINFPIITDKVSNNYSYKITFTQVEETPLCLAALGPASAVVDLSSLENGNYQIELNNADLKNTGTLKVTDSEIKLIFGQQNGIEILRPVTKRVPPNTYWGTIGYHTAGTAAKVDEFLRKLADNGAVFNKQAPGHYVYYEIDKNGNIVADTKNSGYYFLKAFIFQYHGDEETFKAQIKSIALPYYNDLRINVETSSGQRVNNWTK